MKTNTLFARSSILIGMLSALAACGDIDSSRDFGADEVVEVIESDEVVESAASAIIDDNGFNSDTDARAEARQPAGEHTKGMGIHEYSLRSEKDSFVVDLFAEDRTMAGRVNAVTVDGMLSIVMSYKGESYSFMHTGLETHAENRGETLNILHDEQGEPMVEPEQALLLERVRPAMELAVAALTDAGLADKLDTNNIAAPGTSAGCYRRTSSSFGKSAPCASINIQAGLDCSLSGFSFKGACVCTCNIVNWCSCYMDYCCR